MSRSVDTAREPHDEAIEATRYRRAAEEALDQLQECINVLYRIGKPRIAEVVAANYRSIRRRVRDAES